MSHAHRLHLLSRHSAPALMPMEHAGLLFEWNEEEGTFSGRDAERAREIVAAAERAGLVGSDAMRSRADLAAAFAPLFVLPPYLAEARPIGDSGPNVEPDVGATFGGPRSLGGIKGDIFDGSDASNSFLERHGGKRAHHDAPKSEFTISKADRPIGGQE